MSCGSASGLNVHQILSDDEAVELVELIEYEAVDDELCNEDNVVIDDNESNSSYSSNNSFLLAETRDVDNDEENDDELTLICPESDNDDNDVYTDTDYENVEQQQHGSISDEIDCIDAEMLGTPDDCTVDIDDDDDINDIDDNDDIDDVEININGYSDDQMDNVVMVEALDTSSTGETNDHDDDDDEDDIIDAGQYRNLNSGKSAITHTLATNCRAEDEMMSEIHEDDDFDDDDDDDDNDEDDAAAYVEPDHLLEYHSDAATETVNLLLPELPATASLDCGNFVDFDEFNLCLNNILSEDDDEVVIGVSDSSGSGAVMPTIANYQQQFEQQIGKAASTKSGKQQQHAA